MARLQFFERSEIWGVWGGVPTGDKISWPGDLDGHQVSFWGVRNWRCLRFRLRPSPPPPPILLLLVQRCPGRCNPLSQGKNLEPKCELCKCRELQSAFGETCLAVPPWIWVALHLSFPCIWVEIFLQCWNVWTSAAEVPATPVVSSQLEGWSVCFFWVDSSDAGLTSIVWAHQHDPGHILCLTVLFLDMFEPSRR